MAKITSVWQKATPRRKRFKILFWGPPGSFKTRTILRLGNVKDGSDPALAMADLEFGTDHYSESFNFLCSQELEPDQVMENLESLAKTPGSVKILGFDGFAVYYESLVSKFSDLFLKREISSAGWKKDYYTLQPRDYQPINREAYNLVRLLLKCDLHVLATSQTKDKWGANMKVEGTIPDGPKKIPHYFDTIIEIKEGKKEGTWKAFIKGKDRSGHFKPGEEIPWENDEQIADFLTKKFGQSLVDGPEAESFVEPKPKVVNKVVNKATATAKKKEPEKEPEPDPEPEAVDTQGEESPESPINEEIQEEPVQEESKPEPEPEPEPTQETAKPVDTDKAPLFLQVLNLKKDLHIIDRGEWNKLLEPFKVKTAKDLTIEQLDELIKKLTAMVPS